jgi:hypothetical protein
MVQASAAKYKGKGAGGTPADTTDARDDADDGQGGPSTSMSPVPVCTLAMGLV